MVVLKDSKKVYRKEVIHIETSWTHNLLLNGFPDLEREEWKRDQSRSEIPYTGDPSVWSNFCLGS